MEQIIATHTVKPSSPTPLHLKTHRLSFLDQIVEPTYIPLIFYYQNQESEQQIEISRRLRQSLSEVLTIFYPFAGTFLREKSFVECNDSGAEMVEARIHAPLQQFTQDPEMEELERLLPVARFEHRDNHLLLVKANYFDCGGVALGVCFSHKVGDAASFIVFMNAWAATCRGEASQIIPPSFDMSLYFPPIQIYSSTADPCQSEKTTTKRIVFEREKIEKLKKEASTWVKGPSRVEALSAFIWKAAIEAYKAKSGVGEGEGGGRARFIVSQGVNLRPRTVPPIPDHHTLGNCAVVALAFVSWEEDAKESGVHVSKLRAAIKGVDEDYINNVIKDGDKFIRTLGEAGDIFEDGNCLISSWLRFPTYEVDFGWGKPLWVSSASTPCANLVSLFSTPSGDAIEAWISISQDDLHFFHVLQANSNNLLLH